MTENPQSDESPTFEDEAQAERDEAEAVSADPEDSDDLGARLEEAEREKEQFRIMALRYAADLENYKKRAAQELGTARERANSQIILKLIDVADDFGRAIANLPEDAIDPSWFEGIQLAMRRLENMLESEGVSRIEAAIGQPFDASQHEAVFLEPTDEVDEGGVVRVVRNGYRLHDRVLRAAQVSVAKPL